jgi:hypothetical protein
MSLIVTLDDWETQPDYPAPLDCEGLGRGMRMLFNPALGALDLVTGRRWAANGNAGFASTDAGSVFTFDGVDDFFEFTGYPEISGNTGTLFLYCPIVGTNDINGCVLIGSQSPNAFAPQVNGNRINIPGPGYNTTGAINWFNTTNSSLVMAFGGTAAAQRAYFNGQDTGMVWSGSAPTAWGAGNKTIDLGRYPGGNPWDFQGTILIAGWTDVVWTENEAAIFHNSRGNAIYEPEDTLVWLPSAGGANNLVGATSAQDNAASDGAVNNLTVNPGFEAGDISWTKETGFAIVNDPANARTGSWVAKRNGGYGVPAALRSVLSACNPGEQYQAAGYIKFAPGSNGYGYMRFISYTAQGAVVDTAAGNMVSANSYGLSVASGVISATAANVRAEFVSSNFSTGTMYADDAALWLVPSSSAPATFNPAWARNSNGILTGAIQ